MQLKNVQSARERFRSSPFILVMLIAFASLYGLLFRLDGVPVWIGFDQMGSFILDASRFWGGAVFYRDFFDLTPPGIECVHALYFALFGQKNWIPNANVLLCGLLLAGLMAYIGSRVFPSRRFLAILPAILFLAFGFVPVVIDSHRWFSSAACYAALAALIDRRNYTTLLIAGGFCGLASFFTQTQGPISVAGIIAFLCWEGFREKSRWQTICTKALCVLAAFVSVFFASTAYFIWAAGIRNFWDCLYVFPAKYAPLSRSYDSIQVYLSEFPRGPLSIGVLDSQGRYALIHLIVPLTYLVSLALVGAKKLKSERDSQTMLITIMGLFLFLGVAPSPSYFRLCSVSGPAMIILVTWLENRSALHRFAVGALWCIALFTLIRFPMRQQSLRMEVLSLPRGPFAFSNTGSVDYQILSWVAVHTRPGSPFFSAGETGLFYPLSLQPIDKTTGYDNTGFTRIDDVEDAVSSIQKYHPQFIEWPPDTVDSRFYHPEEDHLLPLTLYVQSKYHRIERFTDASGPRVMEIWQRID